MGLDEHEELQELPTGLSIAVHTLLKKVSQTLLRMLSSHVDKQRFGSIFPSLPTTWFPCGKIIYFFFFFAVSHSLWDLSSQTRDQTWPTAVSAEA